MNQAIPQTRISTLDVRGQRADQAVASVLDFLDGLYGRGINTAYIIYDTGPMP